MKAEEGRKKRRKEGREGGREGGRKEGRKKEEIHAPMYPNVHCSTVYNSQDMEAT